MIALCACAALALCAQEPPPAHLGQLQSAVDAAIDRGVDHLLSAQNRDGSWGTGLFEDVAHFDKRNGETGLVVYTLRKCRVPADSPALERASLFLEAGFPTKNYSVATELLALEALGDARRFEKRIEELLDVLLESRIGSAGVWGYPDHPGYLVDLSNTQYAALALRAAQHAGLKVPKGVWLDLVEGVLAFQQDGQTGDVAGFGYSPGERGSPSASMTTAGISVLQIAREGLGKSLEPQLARTIDRAQRQGLNWLAQQFDVAGNPGGNAAWHFYYLYGLERVGALLALERIGTHDWYREGAEQLVKEQQGDGSWRTGGPTKWPAEPLTIANTCFALLFLEKATAPSSGVAHAAPASSWSAEGAQDEVWLRASGRSKLAVWISGYSPRVAETYGEPGAAASALRIAKVEFLVDGAVVHTLERDPSQPAAGERFACQHEFTHEGEHVVQARVHVQRPSAPEQPPAVLESAALKVVARDVLLPWMLEYARGDQVNKLREVEVEAASSSQHTDWNGAAQACDGLQGTAWLCAVDDAQPWIRLDLRKPTRAKAVVLSHANANPREIDRFAHVTKLALVLNQDERVEFELGPELLPKVELALPKPLVLRSLELRVLAVAGGTESVSVAGFAEIELR